MSQSRQQDNGYEAWNFPIFEPTLNTDSSADEPILEHPEPVIDNQLADEPAITADNLLENKLHYLDTIAEQIQQTLASFDAEIFPQMISLIKKSVKKIILKELACDESRFPEMIASSVDSMIRDNQPCVIYVSAEDNDVFANHASLAALDIRVDTTLAPGDFIIKNPLSELQAILEQRLNRLFGC